MTDRPVHRRAFLGASLAAAGAAALPLADAHAEPNAEQAGRELYEWRTYRVAFGPRVARLGDYFRDALVPALRRAGAGPVGVFTVATGMDAPAYHVLVPYPSADLVATMPERLADDAEYRRAGAPVLEAPAQAPAYDRVETSLFRAFRGMPRLELPPQTAANARRLFELRRYESPGETAHRTKVAMFDDAEIAVFRKAGMHPVFFGSALAGPNLPNLTYLLAFDDMADHDAQWGRFANSPEWKALSSRPELNDAVVLTSISNAFLRPTPYSQV